MRKEMLSKTLVMSIVVLFIGVSCSSAISVNDNISSNYNIQIDDNFFYFYFGM